jgi:hypothetical protein
VPVIVCVVSVVSVNREFTVLCLVVSEVWYSHRIYFGKCIHKAELVIITKITNMSRPEYQAPPELVSTYTSNLHMVY